MPGAGSGLRCSQVTKKMLAVILSVCHAYYALCNLLLYALHVQCNKA